MTTTPASPEPADVDRPSPGRAGGDPPALEPAAVHRPSPEPAATEPALSPPTPPDLLATLARTFPQVAPSGLDVLARRGHVRAHPAGSVLCHQGEHEDSFCVILTGQLDVFVNHAAGREFATYLPAASTLGGLEYFTEEPRVADVVASEPVTVLEMTHEDLDAIAAEHPGVLKAIARELLVSLTQSRERFMELSATSARAAAGTEVFVSYAREDVDFARRLTNGLRRLEIPVWLDVFSIAPGKSWARQVGEALDRCPLMVLIVSPHSMASENSDDEWNYFLDKRKEVIPVLYEPAEIPFRLKKLQYVDFTGEFDSALTRLAVAIRGAAIASRG